MYLRFERVCQCRKLPNFCFKPEAAQAHCKSGHRTLSMDSMRHVCGGSRREHPWTGPGCAAGRRALSSESCCHLRPPGRPGSFCPQVLAIWGGQGGRPGRVPRRLFSEASGAANHSPLVPAPSF